MGRPEDHRPVSDGAPEGSCDEFHEGPDADEEAGLEGVHAHLLEVHGHEREEGTEGGEEEEVERLGEQELLVDIVAEHVNEIRAAADFVGRFLGLGIGCGVDLAMSFRVYEGPRSATNYRGTSGPHPPLLLCRVYIELPLLLLLLLLLLHAVALVIVVANGLHLLLLDSEAVPSRLVQWIRFYFSGITIVCL